LEVLNREVAEVTEKISVAVEHAASPIDKFRVFVRTKFLYMKEAINISNLGREEMDVSLPKTHDIRDRLFSREISILHSILEKGVKEGTFDTSNAMLAARAIGYALRGFEVTRLLGENDGEIEKYLDGLSEILCRGILIKKEVI